MGLFQIWLEETEAEVTPPEYLFHGSAISGLQQLDPSRGITTIEKDGDINWVYAADSKQVASAFTFPWTDDMGIQFGCINDEPYILEIPEKLLHLLDNPCSIYTLPGITFEKTPVGLRSEWRSKELIQIVKEEKFKSSKEAMEKYSLKVHIISPS